MTRSRRVTDQVWDRDMNQPKSPNGRGQRCYVYKVVVDNGGAPCVYYKKLSLAICKPAIRRTAHVGDLIFGFGGNTDTPANRLVYIAEITNKSTDGNYYYDPESIQTAPIAFTSGRATDDLFFMTVPCFINSPRRDRVTLEITLGTEMPMCC